MTLDELLTSYRAAVARETEALLLERKAIDAYRAVVTRHECATHERQQVEQALLAHARSQP